MNGLAVARAGSCCARKDWRRGARETKRYLTPASPLLRARSAREILFRRRSRRKPRGAEAREAPRNGNTFARRPVCDSCAQRDVSSTVGRARRAKNRVAAKDDRRLAPQTEAAAAILFIFFTSLLSRKLDAAAANEASCLYSNGPFWAAILSHDEQALRSLKQNSTTSGGHLSLPPPPLGDEAAKRFLNGIENEPHLPQLQLELKGGGA